MREPNSQFQSQKLAGNYLARLIVTTVVVVVTGCGTPMLSIDEKIDRAAVLCDRGRGEEALQLLDQVTSKEDIFPRAYFLKGIAFELNHELLQAKKAYDKCIEQSPEESDAYNNRGSVQFRLGNIPEAINDLVKATVLNPNDDLAWSNLSLAQQEQGLLEDAIISIRRAITVRSTAAYFLQLGNLFNEKADYAQAEIAFTEALKLDAHNASAFLSRSMALSKLGRKEDALADLKAAQAADSSLSLHGSIRLAKLALQGP
jgi:tetratricopeptide (TPR) repeat protein